MKHLVIGLVLLGMFPVAQAHEGAELEQYVNTYAKYGGSPPKDLKKYMAMTQEERDKLQFVIALASYLQDKEACQLGQLAGCEQKWDKTY